MADRPQNKNLISLDKRSEEERRAIQSAGGKACAEKKRQQKRMAEMLEIYSGLPINDKRKKKRLEKLGIPAEALSQKTLIADAIMKAAQSGNMYAVQMYLDIIGESGVQTSQHENNLLEALVDSTKGDMSLDDISEIQQASELDSDMVEQTGD